jgi:signal transduction histidine kinase
MGRLAGGVAHDFNNLLTGVLLYCDLLMANPEPGNRVRRYAEEIRNAGMQASGMVGRLLAVARPRNHESRLLSLNETAEEMRNLLVRLIGENIELQLRLDPNLGPVKMDPAQAQQILLNLVLNGRDALPAGGRIMVETANCKVEVLAERRFGAGMRTSLPCALLVVGDNGTGMDTATRAHLFEAFFSTKAGKGTGLGLATVSDIVASNGGLIYVDSAPGCGTRVSVLLPLAPQAVLTSQNASEPEQCEGELPAIEKATEKE